MPTTVRRKLHLLKTPGKPKVGLEPVEAFGYRRITVERPLRLNFQASSERIERLDDENPVQKLDEADCEALRRACGRLAPDKRYTSRKTSRRT